MTCLLVVNPRDVEARIRLHEWLEALGYGVLVAESLYDLEPSLLEKSTFIVVYTHNEASLISKMLSLNRLIATSRLRIGDKPIYFVLGEETDRCWRRSAGMLRFGMSMLGVTYYTSISRLQHLEIILPKPTPPLSGSVEEIAAARARKWEKSLLLVRRHHPEVRALLQRWLEERYCKVVHGECLLETEPAVFRDVDFLVGYLHDEVETISEMLALGRLREQGVLPLYTDLDVPVYFVLGREAWQCACACAAVGFGMHYLGVGLFVELKDLRGLEKIIFPFTRR